MSEFVLITGLSGAGRSQAANVFEDMGWFVIDNLPPALIEKVAELAQQPGSTIENVALVVGARDVEDLSHALGALRLDADAVRIVFLDARDDVLVRRAGESTRPHPLASAGSGVAAVTAERELLEPLRAAADVVVDTSELTPSELQRQVREVVLGDGVPAAALRCTVSSFGHKFGAAAGADWLLDARLVRNPFWVDELRSLTGVDAPVRDYVLADPASQELLEQASRLLQWAADRSMERGRRFLHVAVGCTGGRHRSVVLAEELAARLRGNGLQVTVRHRDVDKPDPRA